MAHDTAERLQKALAQLGLASRREAEEWIRAGRLTVNGQPASLGMRVRDFDQIRLDGRLVRRRPQRSEAQVFLYHRSPGDPVQTPGEDTGETHSASAAGAVAHDFEGEHESSADSDHSVERAEPASASRRGSTGAVSPWRTPLKDRLPRRAGRRFITVSPMPNVDGGLELLTSDGELAEKLQRSVRRLESEFSVRVHGELGEGQMGQIREGVLDRGTLAVLALNAGGGEGTNRWYTIQARGASGKDIRQLFERQGAIVSRVLRTRLGPVTLDRRLSRGQFRRLIASELESLTAAASGRSQPTATLADREESEPRQQQRKRFSAGRRKAFGPSDRQTAGGRQSGSRKALDAGDRSPGRRNDFEVGDRAPGGRRKSFAASERQPRAGEGNRNSRFKERAGDERSGGASRNEGRSKDFRASEGFSNKRSSNGRPANKHSHRRGTSKPRRGRQP
jgi:23S rRNA pseudouridine2605 synthase